jgi:TolB-like protein
MGTLIGYSGQWERGSRHGLEACELNPHHPEWYTFATFYLHYERREYEEAFAVAKRVNWPQIPYSHVNLAAVCGQLGRPQAARASIEALRETFGYDLARVREEYERWKQSESLTEHILDGLRKAGFESDGSDAGTAAVADGSPPRSLAVLPLANLSGESDQEYFVAGMHDALIAGLAKIAALTVVSRTSVLRFTDTREPLPAVARQLGVDALIEGSVLRSGDRVRINLQLSRMAPETRLWTETYDRDITDVLKLHADIAEAVATAVSATLTPAERVRLDRSPSVDPETYELFLRAGFLDPLSADGGPRSVEYLRQVVERAPDYAPAHSGLARRLVWMALSGFANPAVALPEARAAAAKAVELDPESGEALAVAAQVTFQLDWDSERARESFRRALELEPGNVQALVDAAVHRGSIGEWEAADDLLERALKVDPFSPTASFIRGWARLMAYRFPEAIDIWEAACEVHPTVNLMPLWIAFAHVCRDRDDEALRWARRAETVSPDSLSLDSLGVLTWIYIQIDRLDDARRILARYERLTEGEGRAWWRWNHLLALGQTDAAYREFVRAFEERHPLLVILPLHPIFAAARAEPRFKALIDGMKLEVRPPAGMDAPPAGRRAGISPP